MNTTFIIGNGFDLCQNMATRYCQFYENHYIKLPTEGISPAIQAFRKEILDYVKEEHELKFSDKQSSDDNIDWSDLESAIGKYANKLTSAQDYIDIVLDVNRELHKYIEEQERTFAITEKVAENIYIDFCRPDTSSYLNPEESLSMRQFKNVPEVEQINIINFNYTSTIEKVIEEFKEKSRVTNIANYGVSIKNVLHIHGKLGEDPAILVGLNDPSQINNEEFRKNQDVLDVVIKPETNRMLGNGKERMAKNYIKTSRLFVLYGVSLGETDKIWWEMIGKRLQDQNARLIWFVYEEQEESDALLIGRKKRSLINKFCKIANIPNEKIDVVSPQIFIGYNTRIFKYKSSNN